MCLHGSGCGMWREQERRTVSQCCMGFINASAEISVKSWKKPRSQRRFGPLFISMFRRPKSILLIWILHLERIFICVEEYDWILHVKIVDTNLEIARALDSWLPQRDIFCCTHGCISFFLFFQKKIFDIKSGSSFFRVQLALIWDCGIWPRMEK